ncbi:hypothetical protein [Nitrosopumilus sp. Nsub]|uniref:hypothetical protein n=1 Tax=Nitrosopumilus sp. Nsub TaxID=1776294 RepID=UPI00082FA9E4|nr:hypothetical protein [Nitrosopumilus sp. Nsub]
MIRFHQNKIKLEKTIIPSSQNIEIKYTVLQSDVLQARYTPKSHTKIESKITMTTRNTQIGSMFFVIFVVLVTFSIPNASALTPEQQEIYDAEAKCKQDIRSEDSLTFAEKAVNVKSCGIEARLAAQALQVELDRGSQIRIDNVHKAIEKHQNYYG